MYLSQIKIENFRNFSLLDVAHAGNVKEIRRKDQRYGQGYRL